MLGSRRDRDGCAAVWTRDGAGSGCVEERGVVAWKNGDAGEPGGGRNTSGV